TLPRSATRLGRASPSSEARTGALAADPLAAGRRRGDARRARLAASRLARNRARSDRSSFSRPVVARTRRGCRGVLNPSIENETPCPPFTEDTSLIQQALAYAIEL